MSQTEHFDAVAARYDELRWTGDFDPWHAAVVDAGELAGARVLDIGCGTGEHLRVLREQHGCEVSGIDASQEMLDQARAKLPGADLRLGLAEHLPFPDAGFDAALMTVVVQHLDRPRAFAEARRVLAPGGRLIVHTPDPDAFERGWLAPFFPSYVEVERARFPAADALARELRAVGFARITLTPLQTPRCWPRDDALDCIRGRFISTFDLLPQDEYEAGLARAERELPDPVEYAYASLLVRADR
ncbi:MAG: class I SAM-dependent methyltransferase [Gaiellaceae bacterium]